MPSELPYCEIRFSMWNVVPRLRKQLCVHETGFRYEIVLLHRIDVVVSDQCQRFPSNFPVCFFNPGLYRTTGFNGLDTWPLTIKSATSMNCPIAVTSYTEFESPRDLERIQKESDRPLTVVQPPQTNPFASQRPERNFISDEVAPMIFKNFFCFCVKWTVEMRPPTSSTSS